MDEIPEEQETITKDQMEQAANVVYDLFDGQEGLLMYNTEDCKLFLASLKVDTEPLSFLLKLSDIIATMLSEAFTLDFTVKGYKFANANELRKHLYEQITLLVLNSLPVAPEDNTTETTGTTDVKLKGVGSGLLN